MHAIHSNISPSVARTNSSMSHAVAFIGGQGGGFEMESGRCWTRKSDGNTRQSVSLDFAVADGAGMPAALLAGGELRNRIEVRNRN